MINDPGKHQVNGTALAVSLRVGLWQPLARLRRAEPMKALAEQIGDIDGVEIYGRVVAVRGLMIEVAGPIYAMSVGARLTIETGGKPIPCEVVA